MINRNKLISIIPLIIFFIMLVIWHSTLDIFADDLYFNSFYNTLFNFDSSNFLFFRFTQWSWRIIIEAILVVLCKYPILWVFCNSILFTLLAYLTPKLIIKNFADIDDKNKIKYNIIGILLTVIFIFSNFMAIRSAGYIATSLNYTWPFIFGILNIYIFKEYFYQKRKIETYKKVLLGLISIISLIFALNMEIVLICMIMVYLIFILYTSLNGNNSFLNNLFELIKSNKILLLYLLIMLAMLIIFIKCPGNKSRFIQETARWGDYSVLKFYNKIDLSLTTIYCMLLTTKDLIVYIFLLLLAIYSSKFSNKNSIKLVTYMPTIFLSIVYVLSFGFNIYDYVIKYFEPYGLLSHGISLGVIFIVLTYILIICSVLISLYVIYKHEPKVSIIISSLLLIAFISQFVIGFSPSCIIWSYPVSDYPGRWWIIFNGIQIFTSMILIFKLTENKIRG